MKTSEELLAWLLTKEPCPERHQIAGMLTWLIDQKAAAREMFSQLGMTEVEQPEATIAIVMERKDADLEADRGAGAAAEPRADEGGAEGIQAKNVARDPYFPY